MIAQKNKNVKCNEPKKTTQEKWTEKKTMTKTISEKLETIGLKARANRMKQCATMLDFYVCPQCGHMKLKHANYCRDRMCPVCRWRLSLQRYSYMCKIFNYVVEHQEEYGTFKFTLLTLTVKNCKPKDLGDTITQMSKAWDKMCKRKHFKDNIVGWARSLEVTYNPKRYTMHPHYHVMLMWDSRSDIDEITQEKIFRNIWKDTADLDYNPHVRFQKVRQLRKSDSCTKLQSAVLETFKYCVKDKDVGEMPLNAFYHLVSNLNGKRLIAFGGLLKKIKALLQLEMDVLDDGDDIDIECNECGTEMSEMLLRWSFDENTYKRYVLIENGDEIPINEYGVVG